MKHLILLMPLALVGCMDRENPYPCHESPTPNDARPDILVIGDSISIAYTPYMQDGLPAWDVSHNLCNAMWSANGVARIDEWLSQREQWHAITFNHGLWDIADWIHTPSKKYRKNLHYIAQKIKERTDKPLFILTTEVLPGTPHRMNEKVIAFNAIAEEVMAEEGIPVLDLYTFSTTIPHEHTNPNDVHFTETGSSLLADEILNALNSIGVN